MKRVQDLIVGSTFDATVTLANFATKAAGAVNIIDPETGIAWATGGNSAVVVRVCQDSDGRFFIRQSLPLLKRQIRSYVSKDYVAPAPKVMSIDVSAVSPSTGDIFEIFITDYKDFNYIIPRRRIEYVATASDTTAADIKTGLIAAINADVSLPNVNATDGGGDIVTVTGAAIDGSGRVINDFRANYEVLFNIALAENMAGVAVVALVTSASKGCGHNREVLKLEEIYKGYKGYTNRVIYPSSNNIQFDTDTTTPGTYDVTTVMHDQPEHTNNEGSAPAQVSTVVAMLEAAGDAFETAMDLVMAEIQ
jgi:hypothetical protein